MKILYVITGLRTGGAERLLYWTCKYLSKKENVTIEVIYFDPIAPLSVKFRTLPVKIYHFHYNFLSLFRLVRHIHCGHFDIVHTHLIYADILGRIAALILTLFRPIQIFSTAHSTEWFRRKKSIYCELVRQTDRMLSMPNNSHILAVSKSVQALLIETERILPVKIKVLLNGIEFGQNSTYRKQRRDKPLKLLYMGRLSSEKNIPCLIKAMHELKDEKIELSIVGDGKDRAALKQMVLDYKMSQCIQFYKETMIPDTFYQDSDILVLPSKNEGLGMVILEAFSHKMPVIGSRVEGIIELLMNGRGLLFENDNHLDLSRCIRVFLYNPDQRRRCGRAGYDYVQHTHDIHHYVDVLYQLYTNSLAGIQI